MITIGLFTHDFYPYIGGQGRHIFELYRKNEIHKKIKIYFFSPTINSLNNNIVLFPETRKSKFKNVEYSIKLNKKINKIVDNYNLDIAHFHGGPGGIFLFKKLKIPIIYTAHHTYWQQYKYITSQRWKYLFYLLEKKSYQFTDKIICVSNSTKDIIEKKYSIDKSKLIYIPNGIDLNNFKPKKDKNTHTKNILFLGRLDKRKGIDFLIRTMILVNKADPEITLHVVGEGKLRSKLEKYSKKNNLSVIFHGKLSDKKLNDLYESIEIQIVPSIFEGFGLSVLEGMAKNVALIGTNADGIKDIIVNGKTGELINYGDEINLSKKILNLLGNFKKRKFFVNNATDFLKNYDWENIYIKNLKLYEEIK